MAVLSVEYGDGEDCCKSCTGLYHVVAYTTSCTPARKLLISKMMKNSDRNDRIR